jgi:hypothetical protein
VRSAQYQRSSSMQGFVGASFPNYGKPPDRYVTSTSLFRLTESRAPSTFDVPTP